MSTSATVWIVTSCTLYMCCNMLGDDPGTPEGPMEMAGSQVVEAMGGEVPAQQTEQDELT